MTNPDQTAITRQAQSGIQRNAPLVVTRGLVGGSIIATLAVASVAPLWLGGLAPAVVISWLSSLGGNALAGWLNEWAMENLARFEGDDPDREGKLIAQLARDLTQQFGISQTIADQTQLLVQHTDAIQISVDALQGQGDQQAQLLKLLLKDMQKASVTNERLHGDTVQAVAASAQRLLAAQAQGDGVLATQLRAILAAVQAIATTPPTSQTITNQASNQGAQGNFHAPVTFNQQGSTTIGGNVGTYQPINVNGGHVGSIIGSQHNYGTPAPTSSAPPTQDDIDDAADALEIKRKELANASRRAARGVSEAVPQVAQARSEIRRLKAQLRAWRQAVVDMPSDEE